jgi:galactose mutarotase-like enzyme
MAKLARVTRVALEGNPPIEALRLCSPSGRVTATVVASQGAELAGLALEGYGELLYRAGDYSPLDKQEWTGRAPLLWPAVGRTYPEPGAKQFGWKCNGKSYPMPIHGFARNMAFRPSTMSATRESATADFRVSDNKASALCYPFPFVLDVAHVVDDLGWTCTVTVRSHGPLRFGIGNHLTLRVLDGTSYDDFVIASNAPRRYHVSPEGLLLGTDSVSDLRYGQSIAESWLNNTVLGGAGSAGWVEVRYPGGPTVRVTQAIITADTLVDPEDRLFVLYGRPDRGFFCAEPWIGRPNGLQTGHGVIELPPAIPFTWQMRVDLEGL